MLEMKLTVEAPGLTAAMERLAQAIAQGHTGAPSAPVPPPMPAQVAAAAPAAHPAPAPAPATAHPAPAPAPVAARVAPAPAPVAPAPAPVAAAPVSGPQATLPGSAPAAAPIAAPVAPAPTYTVEQIGKAGADLATQAPGKMPELLALLQKYGARAITELKPEQLGAFATELRGLGAKL